MSERLLPDIRMWLVFITPMDTNYIEGIIGFVLDEFNCFIILEGWPSGIIKTIQSNGSAIGIYFFHIACIHLTRVAKGGYISIG